MLTHGGSEAHARGSPTLRTDYGLSMRSELDLKFTKRGKEEAMKYLIAWGLGVPGVVIVIWFLMNHH